MSFKFLFAAVLVACSVVAVAEAPLSLQGDLSDLERVPLTRLAALDRAALLAEDAATEGPGVAPRFAIPHAVAVTPDGDGFWETARDGRQIWRLRIHAEDAVSINLGFTRFFLPEGAHVQIFGQGGKYVVRPFTARDNHPARELWTPVVPGDELVVELVATPEAASQVELEIGTINYGYRGFFEPVSARSGSCNVDVVCPEGDDWQDQIASVAVISTGGSRFCTGFMVNNVAQDDTPYFMTAAHCNISAGAAPSLVAYWNFENSTCRPPGQPGSGGTGDGDLSQFSTGAIWRASYGPSDFTLVEFNNAPDEAYGVYYAGWDVRDQATSSAIAIHHPSTNEKRISFEDDPTTLTTYLSATPNPNGTHIRVADWDLGTTEPGSSGSPLFSPEGRVIGQLHGGFAACGNNDDDWYGRMFLSWDRAGSSASNRLRDWLDPDDTGILFIDGKPQGEVDPTFQLALEPAVVGVCAGDNAEIDVSVLGILDFEDEVTLGVDGLDDGIGAGFSVNPVTPANPAVVVTLTLNNTGSALGQYDLLVTGDSSGPVNDPVSRAEELTLVVSDAAPDTAMITSPAEGAIGVSVTPTIQWSAVGQAFEYELQVATDAGFGNIVYSTIVQTAEHGLTSPLSTNTTYHVRVRAMNDCGDGGWSDTNSFTTEALPGDCPLGTATVSLFSENFDGGSIPTGWDTGGSVGAVTWVPSDSQSFSGSFSVFAQNIPTISDQRLATPTISLPADTDGLFLNFQAWQHIESSSTGCFDGGILEVSTNDGGSWSQVTGASLLTREYDGAVSDCCDNPLENLDAWCGDPRDFWERYAVDLSTWAGEEVRFRFRFGTDSSVLRVGWHVDSVEVLACIGDPTFTLDVAPEAAGMCLPESGSEDVLVNVTVGELAGYTGTVDLSASGEPAGVTSDLDPASVSAPGSSQWTLTVASTATAGSHAITLTGDDGDEIKNVPFTLDLDEVVAGPGLVAPADEATEVAVMPDFSWGDMGADTYRIQVATDAGFGSVVIDEVVAETEFTPGSALAFSTEYFWRVTGQNLCGDGDWSTTFSFVTTAPNQPIADISPAALSFTVPADETDEGVLTIGNNGDVALTWDIYTAEGASADSVVRGGDIVEFNDINFAMPQDGTGGSVQWTTGDTCACDTAPFNFNIWASGGIMRFFWPEIGGIRGGGVTLDGTTYAVLQPGATVGPASDFLMAAQPDSTTENWRQAGGVDGYLGFEFINPVTSQTNYGYVHITTTGTSGYPATIVSWAYNQAGDPITIPEAGSCDSPESISWLDVDPASGSTPAEGSVPVDVLINTAGLSAGQYEALLCVDTNDPVAGIVAVPVSLQVAVDDLFQDRFEASGRGGNGEITERKMPE